MISDKLKSGLIPVSGSVSLFLTLFLYGLVNNMSFTYMGNTNEQFEKYILDNFLADILTFILKIFTSYLIIGLALGIIIHITLLAYSSLFSKKISTRKSFIINITASAFIFLVLFLRDIIMYPQIYMNNFYMKNGVNKLLVDFLTAAVNPGILSVLLYGTVLIMAALYLCSLYKINRKITVCLSIIAGAVILIMWTAGNFSMAPSKQNSKPNVLILASDALRPDHFSGYGYHRDTTPNIDSLIREGASFKNAFVEVPRTFPSWVSILTGQYASTHGIRHMFPTSRDLNRNFKTIVKILNEHGFTSSVVGDYAADIFSRIELGFDSVDTPYFNSDYVLRQIMLDAHTFLMPFLTNKTGLFFFPILKDSAYFCPAEFVEERVIDTLENARQPFFIAAFFSSTHFPYSAPYPYYMLYADKNYSGPYRYFKQRMVSTDEDAALSAEDIRQVNALYDGGLKAFDDSVGGILDFLKENNMLDNTIIIVLSDHGENLYESGLGMGHGEHFRGIYSIKIPLIIRYPGIGLKRREFHNTVRHIDIAPTILSMLDIEYPEIMEGKSLIPVIEGAEMKKRCAFGETGIWFDNTIREDLFFQKQRIMYPDITGIGETDFNFDRQIILKDEYRDIINFAKHRYVFDGRYKLIYMPLKDRVMYELYDTNSDPDDTRNIVEIDRKNFMRLRDILFRWIQRNGDVIVRKDYIYPVLRY